MNTPGTSGYINISRDLMTSSVTPAETVVMSDRNSLELDALNEKIPSLNHLKKQNFQPFQPNACFIGVNLIAVIVLLVLICVLKQIGTSVKLKQTS